MYCRPFENRMPLPSMAMSSRSDVCRGVVCQVGNLQQLTPLNNFGSKYSDMSVRGILSDVVNANYKSNN